MGAVTKREEAGQAGGTVLSQSPSAGSSVRSGEAVSLVVAKASQEVAVPRVVGKKQERAEGELIGAGFVVKSSTRTVSSVAEVGLVLQQTPAGGTKAKRGVDDQAHGGRTRGADHAEHHDHDDSKHHDHHLPDPARRRTRCSMTRALTVALLAGGRSSEHDVSLASASAVREGLEHAGHDVRWVEIERDGAWRHDGERLSLCPGKGLLDADVVFPALHGPFGEDGTVQGRAGDARCRLCRARASRARRCAWTRCSSKS